MGCLRRLFLVGTVIVQVATFGWVMLVIGSAGILSDAALISANDAMVALVLSAIAAVLTLIEVIVLWRGGRTRRRMATELARRPPVMQ